MPKSKLSEICVVVIYHMYQQKEALDCEQRSQLEPFYSTDLDNCVENFPYRLCGINNDKYSEIKIQQTTIVQEYNTIRKKITSLRVESNFGEG